MLSHDAPDYPSDLVRHEGSQRGEKWARKALENELRMVSKAIKGGRNDQLNKSAFNLGRIVAGGYLNEAEVQQALFAAAQDSGYVFEHGGEATLATIRSGLEAGMRKPRHPQNNPWTHPQQSNPNSQTKPMAPDLEWIGSLKPVFESPYLIKGLLDQGALSMLYGPSNSGKTFLTADLAYHVAAGLPWRDHRVKQTGVIYIAAEGGNAIRNRFAALRKHHGGPEDIPLALLPAPVDLLDPNADTKRIIEMIEDVAERTPVKLIVIDTLSRAFAGGDENRPGDMTAFIRNVDEIRQATSAHIMLVHHTGKDESKGARGHSSLMAAVDTALEVKAPKSGKGSLAVEKQRDHAVGAPFHFELQVQVLGKDQDGDIITTCLVNEADAPGVEEDSASVPLEVCKSIQLELEKAWENGEPLSNAHQSKSSGRYAPAALSRKLDLPEKTIRDLIGDWIYTGIVSVEVVDKKSKRKGLRVVQGH